MIKIINFFIPFLLEMLFGKHNDKATGAVVIKASKFKKILAYLIIMISFSFNYFAFNKIYLVSLNYIQAKEKIQELEARVLMGINDKARSDQLEKSLEFCMTNNICLKDRVRRSIR